MCECDFNVNKSYWVMRNWNGEPIPAWLKEVKMNPDCSSCKNLLNMKYQTIGELGVLKSLRKNVLEEALRLNKEIENKEAKLCSLEHEILCQEHV